MTFRLSLTKLLPFLFADDIFLSYSRKDGNAYTAALARELTGKNYKVFFDHYGTPPGKELPKEVKDKALGAKMFVLIASDQALASPHVRTEVELFVNKKHKQNKGIFQCINFGKFDQTEWVSNSKLNTISYISEEALPIQNNKPSQTVINFISDSFVYNKSNFKLRQAAIILGVIMFAMAAITVYFTRQAVVNSAKLNRQARLLDSLRNTEQEARAATSQAQKDLAESAKIRDSIEVLRQKTQGELAEATKENEEKAKKNMALQIEVTQNQEQLSKTKMELQTKQMELQKIKSKLQDLEKDYSSYKSLVLNTIESYKNYSPGYANGIINSQSGQDRIKLIINLKDVEKQRIEIGKFAYGVMNQTYTDATKKILIELETD